MEGRMALKQSLPFSLGQLFVAAGFDWFIYCPERLFVYCFMHTSFTLVNVYIYTYCRYFIDQKW